MTGKALGFKKGDFVHTGTFPGIIIAEVHTQYPCCEVWGVEHELGSTYATELRRLTREQFISMASSYGFDGTAYNAIAQKAIGEMAVA